LRERLPSFAQGAPSNANSSSSSSSSVPSLNPLTVLAFSSSCSLMTVCDRLEAKPIDGAAM
jgi:hypothetical protein